MILRILLTIFFLVPTYVLAVDSDFIIRTIVGDDTEPPTTPTMLSAVPLSSSEIDVSWTTSTDNFSLSGYVLLRDGSPLATTTQTSFSDTGLTEETTYSYEVYAFDSSYNISTTSNALSTTTLAVPVVPPVSTSTPSESSGSSGATRTVGLKNLDIETTKNKALFKWETYGPARYDLKWGLNNTLDDGYIVNDFYKSKHQTTIANLLEGTEYWYELIGYSIAGKPIVLSSGKFKTKSTPEVTPVPNVMRLQFEVRGDDVLLAWQKPHSVSISSIRVVRNYLSFPNDINDGFIVYEGTADEVLDKQALTDKQKQYYTVFVLTDDGRVSSGAIAVANKTFSSDKHPLTPAFDTTTGADPLPEEVLIYDFDTNNISIKQDGQISTFADETLIINYRDAFTIHIPKSALPKNLKSIIVTLLDPTNHRRSYSFLLKLNEEQTAYEATIAPLNVLGASRLQIEIFDFEKQVIGLYRKQINFVVINNQEHEVVFPDKIISTASKGLVPLLWIVFTVLLLLLVGRKLRQN